MVDRRRHLFEPLCLRHRGRGAYGRGGDARQAQGHRGEAAQRAARRCRARAGKNPQPFQSRQCAAVRARRRHLALVAGAAAGDGRAGLERNRGVDAAGARAAVERRSHQYFADLRLHLRHVRRRDRSGDLSGARRPLRVDARCRPHHESDDRRGPDPRRLRARRRRRALRGVHLQRRRRVPQRHLRRLSGAYGQRNSGRRDPALSLAVAVHAIGRQRSRRRQLHEYAGLHRQCDCRSARRDGGRTAGDAAADSRAAAGAASKGARMKPRPFDYLRPDTVEEAVALLAEYGEEARVLAGGQSLVPMLNLRIVEAEALIDISRITALDVIRDHGQTIEIGAVVTQNKLMAWPQLQQKLPLVAAALPHVGHFQTRNKGTVCGSIAHADPSSELPLTLALLGGEIVLKSKRGERVLTAKEFHKDMLTTARAGDELVVAVRFPVANGAGVAFREVARRHGDFAIVAVAAIAENKNAVRLGVGGMAGKPAVRKVPASDSAAAIAAWADELEGYEDLHASAAMRRDLFRNLAPLVVGEAIRCAA